MVVPPTPYQDYIPAPDGDFDSWATAFVTEYAGMGLLIPPVATMVTQLGDWVTAFGNATAGGTRGPATIAIKDAARVALEATLRLGAQAAVQSFLNGDQTEGDLTAAGVRVPSTVQTPRFPPVDGPDLTLRGISPSNVALSVTTPMSSLFRKPIGVTAAQIFAAPWVGASPPADGDLTYKASATRKVINCDTSTVVGQQVRFRARWISVRGDLSNFGTATDVWCS